MDEARKTGIDPIGDVPWGTHLCSLCPTKEDLINLLVPYFQAGLENNEFCLWVTSEPLFEEEARQAMEKAMPGFSRCVESGQIEIVPQDRWYLEDTVFDSRLVLQRCLGKLDDALARGYSGMRVSGDMTWLDKNDWTSFMGCEAPANGIIAKHKMLALCTHCLEKCGAAEFVGVTRDHGGALMSYEDGVEAMELATYKRGNSALAPSEKYFRGLYEQSPIGIELYDSDGTLTGVNKVCLDIFGVSSIDEARGFNITEDRNVTDKVRERLGKGETVSLEIQLDFEEAKKGGLPKSKKTGVADLDVQLTQLGARGEHAPGGYVAQVQDVTRRRRAEHLVQSSETRCRRLFEAAQDGILILDADTGQIMDVNPFLVNMLGYSHDEFVGKALWEISPLKDVAPNREAFLKLQKEGYIHYEHLPLETKDGRPIDVEFVSNVYPVNGASVIQCNIRDITERKRAEDLLRQEWVKAEGLLRQERTRAQEYLDIAEVMLVALNEQGHITMMNRKGCLILGYEEAELIGQNWFDTCLPARLRDELRLVYQRLMAGEVKPVGYFENAVLTGSGEERIIAWHNSIMRDEEGHITGTLSSGEDITERRQAEDIQRQTREQLVMASRLASLGRLASGVAHEINNPLTVVIGGAQMLMEKEIPEDIKEDLYLINDSAQCVAGIVQGLLIFARQSAPGKEHVDINDLVSRVLRIQAHEMKIHDIEVTTKFAPDLPRTMVDVGQIQQVFLNTILNADQAMVKAHNGGHFLVKTEQVGDIIRITFKDDGVGIAREDLPKLFDPFFTTKAVGEGVGLGLSISYGIIQAHNGRIYARGKPGKGATFVVELPVVAKTDQPESPKEPAKKPERTTGRILVVYDKPSIRRVLARSLTQEGHIVETAGDADAALEKLKQERFGAVLLDIRMSDLNGKGLYECLGEIALSLQKRVVFITSDTLDSETQDFLDKTKAPCICKPFDIQELRKSVDQVLMKE